jgi:hypothetical protein
VPAAESTSVLNVGLFLGALASALLAREFAVRLPGIKGLLEGFVGGALMGLGATLVLGCTIGGFFTPMAALSLSAFGMMLGLFFGTYLGINYLDWSAWRLKGSRARMLLPGWLRGASPFVGAAVLLVAVVLSLGYERSGSASLGGLLLFGLALGVVLQRPGSAL